MSTFNVPSPRWYRITKRVWVAVENIFIGVWLVTGHTDSSTTLLIFKIISSQVKDALDGILTNGQEYAPAGSQEALKVMTGASTAKEAVQIVNTQVLGKGFLNEPIKPAPEETKS